MAVGDIYQLTISGTLQGQRIMNVSHYSVDVDALPSALSQGMFNWAAGTLIPAIVQVQSNNFHWDQVFTQKIWPVPVFIPVGGTVNILGANVEDSLPAEVAATITRRSVLAGPRYRGRIYVAGIALSMLDQTTGLFNAAFTAGAAATEAALHASIPSSPVGGSLGPVLYHRADHTTTVITSALSRATPRSQRRRQVGRGI